MAPSGSKLRFGLDMDYQKEWDGEPWLPAERASRPRAKRNGASRGAGEATSKGKTNGATNGATNGKSNGNGSEVFSDADWQLTLSPEEAREYIQNLTRMLKSQQGEGEGDLPPVPARQEKLP